MDILERLEKSLADLRATAKLMEEERRKLDAFLEKWGPMIKAAAEEEKAEKEPK